MKIYNIPRRILAALNKFASTDETRPAICGVLFQCTAGEPVKLVATDGRKMAILHLSSCAPESGHFVVSKRLIEIAVKNLDTDISLDLEDGVARFSSYTGDKELSISGALIRSDFPNYQQVIPNPIPSTFASADTLIVNAEFLADCAALLSDVSYKRPGVRVVQDGEYGVVVFAHPELTVALMPMRMH